MKKLPQIFTIGVFVLANATGAMGDVNLAQASTQGNPSNRPISVFILAGQSNAQGYNHVREYKKGSEEFPEALRRQQDVLFWLADHSVSNLKSKSKSDHTNSGSWEVLRVGDNGSFGPEISFAYDMAKALPNQQVAIIKCAAGGTGIARSMDYSDYIPALQNFEDHGNNWSPPSEGREAGILYGSLITNVKQALSSLENEQREWNLKGVIWMQGEHEAGISRTMATDYDKLLSNFMGSVRSDLTQPCLPFIIGEINSHIWAFGDIARTQQARVCDEDRNAILIKTVDLSRSGSGGAAHFDADSMLLLGSRFAKGFHRLEAENRNEAGVAKQPDAKDD